MRVVLAKALLLAAEVKFDVGAAGGGECVAGARWRDEPVAGASKSKYGQGTSRYCLLIVEAILAGKRSREVPAAPLPDEEGALRLRPQVQPMSRRAGSPAQKPIDGGDHRSVANRCCCPGSLGSQHD